MSSEVETSRDKTLKVVPRDSSTSLGMTVGLCLVLVVTTWFVFGQATRFPFVDFDDPHYIYENPEHFTILSKIGDVDYSHHRWTLDTPEDLEFVRTVYQRLGNDDRFYWRDALALLEHEPALVELNRHVTMRPLQDG